MGKRSHAWIVGWLTLAVVARAVSASPLDRLPSWKSEIPNDPVPVRLEFSDEPTIPPQRSSTAAIRLPAEIPGGVAAGALLPRFDPSNVKAFEEAMDLLFPPILPSGVVMPFEPGPEGRPVTLDDLERYARQSNPYLAASVVEPTTRSTFLKVELLTSAGRQHAEAIAAADRERARLLRQQIESEVTAGVRRGFFAVLAAQEAMKSHEAFARHLESLTMAQIDEARRGLISVAEPLAARAAMYESRAQLVQARNRYISAWKQLAAAVGRFDLEPALLEGRIDRPCPLLDFESLHNAVVAGNLELRVAAESVDRARADVQRASLMPFLIGNRQSLTQARVALAQAEKQPDRIRASLARRLVDAFERYDTGRRVAVYYRDHILPDQARVCRSSIVQASFVSVGGTVDVVAAQRAYAGSLATYLDQLTRTWFAIVDLAQLTHARDVFAMADDAGDIRPDPVVAASFLHWPEVMPTFDEPPQFRASRSRTSRGWPETAPGLRPSCDNCDILFDAPRSAPPVTGQALVSPLAGYERSTVRRRFFTWPKIRDVDMPLTLPSDDGPACCPPQLPATPVPERVPQMLPQSNVAPADERDTIRPMVDSLSKDRSVQLPKIVDARQRSTPTAKQAEAAPTSRIPSPIIINGPGEETVRIPPPTPPPPAGDESAEPPLAPAPRPEPTPVVAVPPLRLPPLK